MIARVVAIALVAVAALATDASFGEEVRLPRPRPVIEPPAPVAEWADAAASHFGAAQESASAAAAVEQLAPLPRPRPERPAAMLAMVAPKASSAPPAAVVSPSPPSLDAAEFASCLQDIRALGVKFEVEDPIDDGGGCDIPHPLKVTNLGSGVAIGPETILNCRETRSLAKWVHEVLVPVGVAALGERPTRISQDSAYVCRKRYNDPSAKISEHARANAIDIAAFEFGDRDPVDVGRNTKDSPEAACEAAVRAGSCRYFTTVLGPGSNAAHATHFHFDMAQRRGGYRLCELGPTSKIADRAENTKRE
jgi:hypothetical protein